MKYLLLIFLFFYLLFPSGAKSRDRAVPTNMLSSLSLSPDGHAFIVTDTGLEAEASAGSITKSSSPAVYRIQLNNKKQIEKLNFISLKKERLLEPIFISKNEVIAVHYPSQILIWNLLTKAAPRILSENGAYAQVHLLSDGKLILTNQNEVGVASLNQTLNYSLKLPISYQSFPVYSGDLSPAKKLILLTAHQQTNPVQFWNVKLAKLIWSPAFSKGAGGHIAAEFLSDSRALIASSKIQILNLEEKKVVLEFPKGESLQSVYSHSISNDKKLLGVGSGNEVNVWDLEHGTELAKLQGFSGEVISVHFLQEANQLIAMDRYKIEIWDFRKKLKIYTWSLKEFSKP